MAQATRGCGWEEANGEETVARFPFRHLSLTGLVTREFSSSFQPYERPRRPFFAAHPWIDSRDISGFCFPGLQLLESWTDLRSSALRLGWLGCSDPALCFEIYPLLFFFFKPGMMMSNVMLMLQLQTQPPLAQPL